MFFSIFLLPLGVLDFLFCLNGLIWFVRVGYGWVLVIFACSRAKFYKVECL